ncbi:MAG: CCA tRNA nucleotidyltransferase [Desulfobacteraceae bacterium]|nr:CCA tRNA nucleotidyltransferase [Desulfobacteraceae bacterium]
MKNIEQTLKEWIAPVKVDLPPLFIVGGIVRDYILSRTINDIDIVCTNAIEAALKLSEIGGAVVVPFKNKSYAPCYRIIDRNNKKLFLDIVQMQGENINEDLKKRDFTINAIAIELFPDGSIGKRIDPLNGQNDIKQGKIKMADSFSFKSDPLRILRAFRLAAELDFIISSDTLSAISRDAHLLVKVSSERILSELYKIFNSKHSSLFVRMMDDYKVLEILFPEIIPMKGCKQNDFHNMDVWEHSMAVLEKFEHIINNLNDFFGAEAHHVFSNLNSGNRLQISKIASLFHDVGKPESKKIYEDSGRIYFHGHDKKGGEISESISQRLKLSKKDKFFIKTLITEHMHILLLSRPEVTKKTTLKWIRKLKQDIVPLIIMEMADSECTLGPESNSAARKHHLNWSIQMINKYFNKYSQQFDIKDFINGKNLIGLGLKPGPEIGRILKEVREAQDSGQVKNKNEALALASELSKKIEVLF